MSFISVTCHRQVNNEVGKVMVHMIYKYNGNITTHTSNEWCYYMICTTRVSSLVNEYKSRCSCLWFVVVLQSLLLLLPRQLLRIVADATVEMPCLWQKKVCNASVNWQYSTSDSYVWSRTLKITCTEKFNDLASLTCQLNDRWQMQMIFTPHMVDNVIRWAGRMWADVPLVWFPHY